MPQRNTPLARTMGLASTTAIGGITVLLHTSDTLVATVEITIAEKST